MHKKTALITGGTRGIGLGISLKLAEEKWDLALCGRRDRAEVKDVLENLRSMGIKVEYYRADISKRQDGPDIIYYRYVHRNRSRTTLVLPVRADDYRNARKSC